MTSRSDKKLRKGDVRDCPRVAEGAKDEGCRREKVLLHLASCTGPAIDRVDIVADPHVVVRDLVLDLVEKEIASPAEIRAVLADLVDEGLAFPLGECDLNGPDSRITITPRGLVAARAFDSEIGRPMVIDLVRKASSGEGTFDVTFDTGDRDRDRELNRKGNVLAIFYLLAMELPTVTNPLTVNGISEDLEILAALGIGSRRGPGERLGATGDTVRAALATIEDALRPFLRLKREAREDDRREFLSYLEGPFPEVRLRVTKQRRDARSWSRLLDLLRSKFYGARESRKLARDSSMRASDA